MLVCLSLCARLTHSPSSLGCCNLFAHCRDMYSRPVQVITSSALCILRSQCRAVATLRSPARLAAGPARQLQLVAAYTRRPQAEPADTPSAVHPSTSGVSPPPEHQEWSGLQGWRQSEVDTRRHWGEKGPVSVVLLTADPLQKAVLTHHAWQHYKSGQLPVGMSEPPGKPSRPSQPQLVPQKQVPMPKQSPLPLPVYMLHNLAHVELNAIDLAWDTVARFSPLKLHQSFYADFARVADDESRHLGWCLQRLKELGHAYGDMVAHNMLWEGAQASSGDLAGRLAVVPMSQEARGLDAGPRLAERLVGCGDNRTAAIVARIALEEKAHVAVGVSWFTQLAAATGQDPAKAFRHCITSLGQQDVLKPPYNHASRTEVGLQQNWYDRTMWPEDASAASPPQENKHCNNEVTSAALNQLKQRMAVMLDTEAKAAV